MPLTALPAQPGPADGAVHSYSQSPGGLHRRHVRLRNGATIITNIGRGRPMLGESVDATAERVLLGAATRPDIPDGRKVRVVDMFSGCGGLSLGLWEAARAVGRSFESAAAFDSDETALGIYEENFNPAKTYSNDVRRLFPANFQLRLTADEQAIRKRTGRVDFLLAGPPCQGFTALNNTRSLGNDRRNHLYARVARLAQVLEPDHVIIENLNSVRRETERVVDRTVHELERLGYEVYEATVPLVAIGVAQRRRRNVVVATTAAIDLDAVIKEFTVKTRDLRWAIGDLAHAGSEGTFDTPSEASNDNVRRMQYLRDHDVFNLPNSRRPDCHRDGDHTYNSMYGRLRWDKPTQTITSGYGSMGQGRYVHPNGRRTLTPHEAARIQFFPDWFDFGHRTRSGYAQAIGNAVPMKLSYVLGLWLLR
jgi:DNA (cytosine-5)-methyltransferase 1